jgi:glycosyltransferase involved in cell wall biosynthesis
LSAPNVRDLFEFLDEFQPDIVHAHDPALIGLIGQVWARMNSVPFVHTSHVLPSRAIDFGTKDTIQGLPQNPVSDFAIQSVLSNFFSNCDALIALNQPAYESIMDFGYSGPVFIIPNGRALADFNNRDIADITTDPKILVFIGYINDRKNQLYLLKVLKQLPENYILRLVGEPLTPDYKDKLDNYIEKHGLTNIEFLGQVEYDKIPLILETAHLFISASTMEVQSLAVIEALASGTPVVGLSNETIDEMINIEVGAWLAKSKKASEFADQIKHICTLPADQYLEMSLNARNKVEHLDWANIVDLTTFAYREILTIKLFLSENESDMLTSLVNFFTTGDARDYLLDAIGESRKGSPTRKGLQVPGWLESWIRVPTSTWLISGMTILISVIGFLFMRGKDTNKTKPENDDA